MECKFYIGQKVVCIDNDLHEDFFGKKSRPYSGNMPIIGHVYTIRSLQYVKHCRVPGVYVRLVEIVNPIKSNGREDQFEHTIFKPLEEKKTDISIFTDMLIKQPEKVT